jgi:tetratricopeptide (TPR) repeat protein
VGWFWFLGTLAPAIGLIQVGRQSMADRYSYIPSIGVLLAFVWGASELTEAGRISGPSAAKAAKDLPKPKNSKPQKPLASPTSGGPLPEKFAGALGVAAGLVCILLTVRQITFWKDSKTLFAHAAEVTTAKWIATGYLGLELERIGDTDEAIVLYEQSLQINPNRTEVRCRLAHLLLERQRFGEALAQFQLATSLDPKDVDARKGRRRLPERGPLGRSH